MNAKVLTKTFHASKNSRQNLLNRLAAVECPDTTRIIEKFPTVFKKGSGIYITDVNQKKYLDFTSCFGVLALGHRSTVTLNALRKQAAQLIHGMGDIHPSESKIKLLEVLAKITPYTSAKTMLGLSGSDAVEIAMKTAVLATNRSKFISFDGAYHGVHLAPLNLNHTPHFLRGFENLITNHAFYLPFPYHPANGPQNFQTGMERESDVLNKLEDALKSKLYAALFIEPIQGRGGIRIFSPEFLQTSQMLCQKYGTLLIFDEIMTGFGRTGKLFAYEHSNVIPDLLCLGKAMGGGLPVSACTGNYMDVWEKSQGEARHTQTFLGHPLTCAVAYETVLAILKQLPSFQKELIKINAQFIQLADKLSQSLNEKYSCFVRGVGFMRGLYFYNQSKGFAPNLMEKLYAKGVLVLPEGSEENVLAILPPLNAKALQYEKFFNSLTGVLSNMQ